MILWLKEQARFVPYLYCCPDQRDTYWCSGNLDRRWHTQHLPVYDISYMGRHDGRLRSPAIFERGVAGLERSIWASLSVSLPRSYYRCRTSRG